MIIHDRFFLNGIVLFSSVYFGSLCANTFGDVEAKGFLGSDLRYFSEVNETQLSAVAEGEIYWQSEAGSDSLNAKLFTRVDDTDDERTHSDIRELNWLRYSDAWELQLGIGKVFWGVTESNHLVDIINQTDAVESADGEEKLGQPMVKLSSLNDWGVIDLYILPYFRERNFVSDAAPLGSGMRIESDKPIYESSKEERHVDVALRYSHSFDVWDFAVSHFSGTSREAFFIQRTNIENDFFITPFYALIERTGLELQATVDAWLWKLEAINQVTTANDFGFDPESFQAFSGGFEYTITGIGESTKDLGLLAEYHFDSRNENSTTALQEDVFLGARLSFNDIQDSAILAGVIVDTADSNSRLGFVEASRRFGDRWVLTLDARVYSSTNSSDPLFLLDDSDHVTLDVKYYF